VSCAILKLDHHYYYLFKKNPHVIDLYDAFPFGSIHRNFLRQVVPLATGADGEYDCLSSWWHLRLGQLIQDKQCRKTVRILMRIDIRVRFFSLQPAGVQF
jgi:hypothetical protein